MTALRAQLRRDKARLEGNGHRPCQESQRRIGATGAQPIDIVTSLFGPERIGRITLLQWLDRPTGMLSPSCLVLRPIRHRRSREIIDQRFPSFLIVIAGSLGYILLMTLREKVESLLPNWERWYPSLFDAASDLGIIRPEICDPNSLLLSRRHEKVRQRAEDAHREKWGGQPQD